MSALNNNAVDHDELRFKFGENWKAFAESSLNKKKVDQARRDFHALVGDAPLAGKRFLDIGFGQGLTLCLAAEAGAEVFGLDIDSDNLAALEMTSRYFGLEETPEIKIGSILDDDVVRTLNESGGFDIVHSWGVLHHTGDMYKAIDNATALVKDDGLFIIAIYNSHWSSATWKKIKKLYVVSPPFIQSMMIKVFYWIIYLAKFAVTRRNPKSLHRGMNYYHNVIDWVGGYPYEYATRPDIKECMAGKGFCPVLVRPARVPTGCNEFVFSKKELNLY